MSGIIETHPNPTSKEAIRDAVISKAIVDNSVGPHGSINAGSIHAWLFGSYDMLRYLLSHIKYKDSRELNTMYKHYTAAVTDITRQEYLDKLVGAIYDRLDGIFTRENYPKFVAARDKAQQLVDNGVMVFRNQRVVDDYSTLLAAPVWDSIMGENL